MIRISRNVGRPTLVALDQHADRVRAKRHRRGVIPRLAKNHSVRLLDVRNNDLLWFAAAPGDACERERSRSQLQEIAPVDRFVPLRCVAWKLTVKQFLEFLRQNPQFANMHSYEKGPTPDCPINGTDWFTAAAYCNWLSEQDDIPQTQWCYETDGKGQVTKLKELMLSQTV